MKGLFVKSAVKPSEILLTVMPIMSFKNSLSISFCASLLFLGTAAQALSSDVRGARDYLAHDSLIEGNIYAQSSQDRFRDVGDGANQMDQGEAPDASTQNQVPGRFSGAPGQRSERGQMPAPPGSDTSNARANTAGQDNNTGQPVPLSSDAAGTAPRAPKKPDRQGDGQSNASTNDQDMKFFDEDPGLGNVLSEKEYLQKVPPEGGSKFVVVEKNASADDQKALLAAARRAREFGRYDAALDFYNRLLKKNKDDRVILLERAITLQSMGRNESAIAAYDRVLDIDPDNLKARINMLGLVRQKYPAVALQKLLDLYDENPDIANLPAQIGLVYADQADFKKAERYLQIAISLEPNNPRHVFNLAIMEDRRGNGQKALKLYEKALELDAVSMSARKLPREQIYDRLAILRERT